MLHPLKEYLMDSANLELLVTPQIERIKGLWVGLQGYQAPFSSLRMNRIVS
jgi:hypothetical protein